MRWAVSHETVYRYTVPVVFAPHVLRLNPLAGRSVVLARTLEAEPTPIAVHDFADAFYNTCTRVSFPSLASSVLRFHSRFEVDVFAPPSLEPLHLAALPWPTSPSDPLAAYSASERLSGEVLAFVQNVADAAGGHPVAYLDRLGQALCARIEKTLRLDGAAQRPEETLALSRGACRDITVLFIAGCRRMGIPARFVSGYQGGAPTVDGRRHLHAWPEAFLPGAGWRGWDPMYGVRVEDNHIALCAAPGQDGTLPIEGGFYFNGPNVTSTLDYAIRVERAG